MTGRMDGGEWLPIEEAAGELQTTALKVLMLIKGGVLCGREATGGWQVSQKSLESLAARGMESVPSVGKGCGGCTGC